MGAWHSREGGAWHSKEGGIASQCVDRAIVNLLQPASTQCDVGQVCVPIELLSVPMYTLTLCVYMSTMRVKYQLVGWYSKFEIF